MKTANILMECIAFLVSCWLLSTCNGNPASGSNCEGLELDKCACVQRDPRQALYSPTTIGVNWGPTSTTPVTTPTTTKATTPVTTPTTTKATTPVTTPTTTTVPTTTPTSNTTPTSTSTTTKSTTPVTTPTPVTTETTTQTTSAITTKPATSPSTVISPNRLVSTAAALQYVNFPGQGWYKLYPTYVTFTQALARCAADGSRVVVTNTRAEFDFVVSLMMNSSAVERAWMGLTDRVSEGKWLTVQGAPMAGTYVQWGGGEPDNKDAWDCIYLDKYTGFVVFDCTLYPSATLCEF